MTTEAHIAITSLADAISWDRAGLVPVIAQDSVSQRVLMMAWMNHEALQETLSRGQMVYWSRSRQRLWHKGETSGNVQVLKSLHLDCDGDTLLADVEQTGGVACHTGRTSCFYRQLDQANGHWTVTDPVRQDPRTLYPEQSS